MEKTKLEYFFKEIEEFRFKEVFTGCTYPWEVLSQIKTFLQKEVVEKNLKENKAQMGEFCAIEGNYFIDEGTVIHPNVTIQGPVLIG